jgi:mersacidin/lichenicidin family type 2 lantibiotic
VEVIHNVAPETLTLPPMSDVDIVRAWRDSRYRRSLSAEQLQMVPGNPAGPTDLTGDELKAAGFWPNLEEEVLTTAIDCTDFTFNHWKACGCAK